MFTSLQPYVWTVACQAPLSMEVSRQEYWSGLPCPPTGDLLDSRTESMSLMSPALVGGFFTSSTAWEAPVGHFVFDSFRFVEGYWVLQNFLKCVLLINMPPKCCNWMHWSICRKAGAGAPLLGHLIIHLAPSDFISFHGCYLCYLCSPVTTTQGLPQPGSLIMFYWQQWTSSLLVITVIH